MIRSSTRRLALMSLAAFAFAACGRSDDTALVNDTLLARDLGRVGVDSTAQPKLEDVPAENVPAPTPSQSAPKSTSRPRPATPTQPKNTNPPPSTPTTTTTSTGNTVTTNPKGTVPAEPSTGTIPSGTSIVLASSDKICTNTNKVGDRFNATVTQTITGSNGVRIPSGATAVVEVTALDRSDNVNDKVVMGFRVISLSFDGKTYSVSSELASAEVDKVRSSTRKDDAKKVIGGAVVGAVIGQVIGKSTKGTVT
ncbi:MAG TPA: hypothetical protein VH762_12980, partial [Gemmatimonadaceae bacterium]